MEDEVKKIITKMKEDGEDDMTAYLVYALVPFQVMFNEAKLETEEDKFTAAKSCLAELGLHGSEIISVDKIPGVWH